MDETLCACEVLEQNMQLLTVNKELLARCDLIEAELTALKAAARFALVSWSCDCKADKSEMFKRLAALVEEG